MEPTGMYLRRVPILRTRFAASQLSFSTNQLLQWAALLSVLAIALSVKGAPLLLMAGAIGGLLARLRKAVKQKTAVFDFGVSWGVMFLMPMGGALTGWIGAAMTDLFVQWEIFSTSILNVNLIEPNQITSVVAIFFGLSATLFDKFVKRFESTLGTTESNSVVGELEAVAAQEEILDELRKPQRKASGSEATGEEGDQT